MRTATHRTSQSMHVVRFIPEIQESRLKQLLKAAVLILMTLATPAFASNWQQLGKERVNFGMERDEIRAASKGLFKALSVEVRGAAVYIRSVTVHYGQDETMSFPVGRIVQAGERTRVIDLPGSARLVRKVVFDYKKVREDAGKAEVVLWGRK